MKISRRQFMSGVQGLTLNFMFGSAFARRPTPSTGNSTLVDDKAGLVDLLEGFTYTIISRAGDTMDDGWRVPGMQDGMGCFSLGPRTIELMCNHELDRGQAHLGPFWRKGGTPPEVYDPESYGGVSRIVVDTTTWTVRSRNMVLAGTDRNCSGGHSPWGWLTCEETVAHPDHGFVFLCQRGTEKLAPPMRLPSLGRFNHEAALVDPLTHISYLTEDREDGCFYRMVPNDAKNPFVGQLQAMRMIGHDRYDLCRQLPQNKRLKVDWVDITNPASKDDTVREEAQKKGAAIFRRGEGICLEGRDLFICSTSGGQKSLGQIVALNIANQEVRIIAEATDPAHLDMPDNITVSPHGLLFMCEDGGSAHKYVRYINRRGEVVDFARNRGSASEVSGVCFDPTGQTMFFNIQVDGLTVMVRGPFASLS